MHPRLLQKVLFVLLVLVFGNLAYAQDDLVLNKGRLCDVPDVGQLSPDELKTKISLLHIWQGAKGGINTKNADRTTGLYDFDFYYLLSAKEAKDNKGDYLLLCVSAQSAFGNGLNEKVGSFFEINENAKGDLNFIIDKLFAEFTVLNRRLTFDIGKIDLEDFFDGSAVAGCEKGQFLARPFYKNATIPFPSKGLGIRAIYEPSESWYAQAAIADAQADKRETGFNTTFHGEDYFFSIGEIGIRPKFFGKDGTYRFILWYDPQDKSYLDESGRTKRDDLGAAVSFDQKITEKTSLFFRYGLADDKVNEVEDFVSFGGQIEGVFNGRDDDVLGIAYANGLRSQEGLLSEAERQIDMIETYYKIKVKDNIEITPNIQFVMDPGGLKKETPATVFGIRCRVKL